jgi:hypothetical protein
VQQAVEAYLALHTAVDSRRIGANYFCCKAPRNKIDLKKPWLCGPGRKFFKKSFLPGQWNNKAGDADRLLKHLGVLCAVI